MKNRISPPETWKHPETHLKELLFSEWYQGIANITNSLIEGTHIFFKEQNIKPFIFPITTGSVSSPMGKGSDSLPVSINIKNNNIFLADSMQFSLELATRLTQKGAYYIMPTFRGEDTDERHLNEFVHSEVEIIGEFKDILVLAEKYISYIIKYVIRHNESTIYDMAGTINHIDKFLKKEAFKKIHFEEALELLEQDENSIKHINTDFPTITAYGEKQLLKEFGDFVWIINLPYSNVPFYQSRQNGSSFANAGDLLAGIGEILGCGERVFTEDELIESLKYHEINLHGYEWYFEMKKNKPLKTSGFGMGMERLILWLTQTEDIRNCTLLYRDHSKIIYP
ncbi:amino acid--tRNA ligase-related protein [uncultured Draconibacterium sp.]|uniref:amino acid--tRNA ligase-related protein n=1 Tax=uncultured Draconibacterium sp. TaxID=1573823 RepID=UPI0032176FE8